jgi:hypothetical protein
LHVHVAEGRFDKDHGETFPLVLRGAFIEGSGVNATIIAGSGVYDARVPKGAINDQVSATIVIGDATLASGVSNLTLYDPFPPSQPAHHAVFCDRGTPTSSVNNVPANTTLDGLSIGPGFDVEIVATTSTIPASTGCNLLVKSTELKVTDVGLWAVGCENPAGTSTSRVPVAVRLGDGTQKGGNQFSGFPYEQGTGVKLSGCVISLNASYNTFTHAEGGVDIVQPTRTGELNQLVFQHNTFTYLLAFGIKAAGGSAYLLPTDNEFTSINPLSQTLPRQAAGMWAEGIQGDSGFVHINASNNHFSGSQVGVLYQSSYPAGAGFVGPVFNGGNVFHCNAAEEYSDPYNVVGGDVILKVPAASSYDFQNNEWDHAPPNKDTSLTVDGIDIVAVPGVTVTTTGATAVDVGCQRP